MKRKPIYTALIAAFTLATITISQSKIIQPGQRFQFMAVTVKINGVCPDTIEASVYDVVTKDTLKYKFKTSGNANTTGQYITMKADVKGNLITGQIIDASANTVGLILLQDNNTKPVIKYLREF